jgi:2-octaprenyl-6-methoxyphenol hydroxylase
MRTACDAKVIVVGGGPAGLAAAALLALEGHDTLLVAPPGGPPDPRTIALMDPALKLLARLDIWPGTLEIVSAPLRSLSIIDELGHVIAAPPLHFSAGELGLEAFGWNIPLLGLVPELTLAAERLGVRRVDGAVKAAENLGSVIALDLADGQRLYAEAAVAADGFDSLLRKAAGIAVTGKAYDQSALVTSFAHTGPHHFCSTERHKPGGAFTTVPLPGNRSSLVWMGKPPVQQSLAALSPSALAREIQIASHGSLGLISDVEPTRIFPMRTQQAERFAGARTFLVGEAAHAFPPVGAQGLNMSLRDAGHVADVLAGAVDAGADSVMEDYDRRRQYDVSSRRGLINVVNTSMLAEFLPLDVLRVGALSAISAFPPLRALVMREGIASGSILPTAMRGSLSP